MKIITLTLNPAFDIHCHADSFLPFHENFAAVTDCNAGGKGVNISRALTKNGIDNHALLVLGDENGDSFLKNLSADPISHTVITVPGRIRENLTLHSDGGRETRISFSGFRAAPDLLSKVKDALCGIVDKDTVLTVTGRNTDGMETGDVTALLLRLRETGVRLVIDSRSFGLKELQTLKPWLIKPNQEEISQYLGRAVSTFEEVLSAAEDLHKDGIANVMISLGAKGALLVCGEGVFSAVPPAVQIRSSIGAGDSSIAGFLAAASEDADAAARLQRAVAFGTAACLREGSLPPLAEDIEKIIPQITVTKIK